ncbi:tetratricopeptide repeat protein [Aromatoleum buckelii]|uniref:Ancillary SecYEG translocon subunit n=1 Tax=Aromatoleum buckelii TaxID=200254 RepID=A0ABX1N156_9RHOO|nr:tetratricopeptide repeat protein [Aromatoleum buckelii]MCK0512039.1 tetratricopeptide repeat protein [Aromatoleum buckelii]
MAVYDLEEQEQISELKAWWAQYGKLITTLAVAAALASVGWQGFRWYQNKQASEAGALYFVVQQAAERGDAQKAREAAGQIIEKFSGTPYAEMAALLSAGVQFSAGEGKNARAQLEWLVENGDDPALRDIARLRLASVLLDEGAHADALARLQAEPDAALKGRFADLRGDVLAASGKPDEARSAYQGALDAIAQGGTEGGETLREVVRLKLQALEG